jgi:hypothetical protein
MLMRNCHAENVAHVHYFIHTLIRTFHKQRCLFPTGSGVGVSVVRGLGNQDKG